MKLDIVRVGRSEISVGWLFVEPSEGLARLFLGMLREGGTK